MEDFNLQYAQHPSLGLLKDFLLEHGTYKILKKKELFSMQGKINSKGAYIKSGAFRYTCVDDKGDEHIVGYAFPHEFVGSLDTWINPTQPSPVTILRYLSYCKTVFQHKYGNVIHSLYSC